MLRILLTLLSLLLVAHSAPAQSESRPAENKGTFLGILFSPVPDAVYAQVPTLARESGVIVTHVLPDSPASQVKLVKHDIVLEYDGTTVRDPHHLAKLIRASKPGDAVTLKYLRGGKEATSKVTLVLGPVLQVAEPTGMAMPSVQDPPRAVGKPGGPPPVTVTAAPLEGNRLRLTIEYYNDTTGRYDTVPCVGTPQEIDDQIKKLPGKLPEFARIAVKRVRELELQKPEPARP
jgi:hypothetical protein